MADSARGLIMDYLGRYGLGDLGDWAWKKYLNGDSIEEIMVEMRNTDIYKNRFPAMETLAKEGRAITEQEYISYEQGLRNLVVQYGVPLNLYTSRDYVAELLTKGVALTEVNRRMQLGQAASTTTPIEYMQEASRLYGVTPGQWASMWMETDRTLPELEKQFAAASIAGEVTMASIGDLSRTMAERLVEAGITTEQARQGVTRVTGEFSRTLPGESTNLSTDQLVAGALGVGGDATKQFDNRFKRRLSQFMGGGGVYTTEQGVGLGSTSS